MDERLLKLIGLVSILSSMQTEIIFNPNEIDFDLLGHWRLKERKIKELISKQYEFKKQTR